MPRSPISNILVLAFVLVVVDLPAQKAIAAETTAQKAVTNATTSNTSHSSCLLCRDTHDCTKAYDGAPGQYCYDWLDTAAKPHACCCPPDAVCKVPKTKYGCKCGNKQTGKVQGFSESDPNRNSNTAMAASSSSTFPSPSSSSPSPSASSSASTSSISASTSSSPSWLIVFVVGIIMLCTVAAVIYNRNRRRRAAFFAATQPMCATAYPATASYARSAVSREAVALGSVAGTFGGVPVGEPVEDGGQHEYYGGTTSSGHSGYISHY